MELEAHGGSEGSADIAFHDLCRLIDAIEQTTGLLDRHVLFRSISRAAETLGVLRLADPSSGRG